MGLEDEPQSLLSEREQELLGLVLERSHESKLYKKLGAPQKARFEEATLAVVNRTLEGADLRTIRNAWKKAMGDSGAEALMKEMQDGLVSEFQSTAQAVTPAIRTAARDVLHVLSDPEHFSSVADVKNFMERASLIRSDDIREGRVLHTGPATAPNTKRTTLHTKK